MLNYEMLKLPKRDKNYEVTLNYNIIDFYKSVLLGKQTKLQKESLTIKLRGKVKNGCQIKIGQKRLFGMQIKKELICMVARQ